MKYLEVTGTGSARQAPDRLDLHLGVTAVRPGVAAALAQVDNDVRTLVEVLGAHRVAEADIRTTGSSVHEEYSGPENARAGFRANQDLTVRVQDLDALASVVAAVVDRIGDAFRLHHVSWGVSSEAELFSRARAAAVEAARASADELAALAGAARGDLLRISETGHPGTPTGGYALAKADQSGYGPQAGAHQVDVTVLTRWELL